MEQTTISTKDALVIGGGIGLGGFLVGSGIGFIMLAIGAVVILGGVFINHAI